MTAVAEPAYRSTSLERAPDVPSRRTCAATTRAAWTATRRLAGLPVVAIVGRPNVGKSTLFNRLIGERRAIVEDRARTTRDRLYGVTEWNDRRFVVIDTGGLEVDPGDAIEERVQDQARLAIEEADVIVFVVDAATGLTPADQEVAETPAAGRRHRWSWPSTRPTTRSWSWRARSSCAWAGRTATPSAPSTGVAPATCWMPSCGPCRRSRTRSSSASTARREADELAELVEEGLAPESSARTVGLRCLRRSSMRTTTRDDLSRGALASRSRARSPRIAIVGRPNVGKSSLLNQLLGEERAIVSDIPGTTRDAIDTTLEWQGVRCASWTRPACGAAARSPPGRPPSATRPCARSRPSAGRTSACWSSTPRTA